MHNWVYHKATGHTETVTEAWDEPVYTTIYEYHTICNGCGKDFGPGEAGVEAAGHHILAVFGDACESYHDEKVAAGEEITDYIHHDAVTKWVEDSPAYYQCSGCGAKKDG